MKASELVDDNFFKALIYGDGGTGKTCFCSQLPGPIEYWDFDNKISSAVRFLKGHDKMPLLEQIEVHRFGSLPAKEVIPAFEARTNFIDSLIRDKKPFPFRSIVLDSITSLSHFLMEDYIFRSQLGLSRPTDNNKKPLNINGMQDYQLYEKHMSRIILGLLKLDVNFVAIAHVIVEKDEMTGLISKKPLVSGQALLPKLPSWFPNVYVAQAKADGTRWLQTQSFNNYMATSQLPIAKEVPMQMSSVLL